jgi:preprotein translocase subunit Sec63
MYNPEYDERGKIFTKVVSKVAVNVIIQTTGQLIHGKIHVKPEERLSDELNLEEKFIAVTNAVIYSLEGQILYEVNFLSLNRSQIIWILPATELLEPKPE